MNNVAFATETPIVRYVCRVMDVAPLSKNTFQVELQSPVGTILDYQAGQYLQLEVDVNNDGKWQSLSYSIANSFNPEQPRRLELFIQKNGELAGKVLQHLTEQAKNNTSIKLTLPMGQAFLQTDLSFMHLLIAAGSGISKIKCISEEILRRQPNADVKIYWSNKDADDFYLLDKFQGWSDQHKNLEFTPILESTHANWKGRSGYIYKIIQEDFENLHSAKLYLCGSPKMVYGTIDKLKSIGLKEENCFSDVFEYAPR